MLDFDKRKTIIFICVTIGLVAFLQVPSIQGNFKSPRAAKGRRGNWDGNDMHSTISMHDKWVVLTTIQKPTAALQVVASLPGWKLIVVADRKTPKDWSLPSKDVVYLDLDAQKALPYQVMSLLPYDSYARKIIGYLYAIQHGAQYIYDSDDDNEVQDNPMHVFQMTYHSTGLVVNTDNLTYNPYPHFGQSTLWPRGYPLEYLASSSSHNYKLCKHRTPVVQQGLANNDPDVDATLRLTRYTPDAKFRFNNAAPPIVIPKGTFLPFNTQNTMYLYKAFWSLFLPVTVTFRTCDIYRGYWAQPLMWLLDQSIGFYPANVVHKRNKHSYIADAMDEVDFLLMGDLVKHLKRWQCSKMDFFACASDLAWDLVKAGYWKHDDGLIMDAWLSDLSMVSYTPPVLKKEEHKSLCYDRALEVIYYPEEQNTYIIFDGLQRNLAGIGNLHLIKSFIHNVCGNKAVYLSGTSSPNRYFKELLVIINISDTESIPIHESVYRKYFPNIIYCGPPLSFLASQVVHQWRVSYVSVTANRSISSCLSIALNLGIRVRGYLYLPDNVIFVPNSLHDIKWNQFWITHNINVDMDPKIISSCQKGLLKCQVFSRPDLLNLNTYITKLQGESGFDAMLKECSSKFALYATMQNEIHYLNDIVFYVPRHLVNVFNQLSTISMDDIQHDIITIELLKCLEPSHQYLAYSSLQVVQHENIHYIFPVQAKLILDNEETHMNHFCAVVSSKFV